MREHPFMATTERLLTAEEFARIPDDGHRYELVEGRLVRMSPHNTRHGIVMARIGSLLHQHAEANTLGAVVTAGGFTLKRGPDTVREPDVAFLRRERIAPDGVPETFWEGTPDLAVEIVSPGDRPSEIESKISEYLARGVRVVWVAYPRQERVIAYGPGEPPLIYESGDTISADDVLPGFACRVEKLFR